MHVTETVDNHPDIPHNHTTYPYHRYSTMEYTALRSTSTNRLAPTRARLAIFAALQLQLQLQLPASSLTEPSSIQACRYSKVPHPLCHLWPAEPHLGEPPQCECEWPVGGRTSSIRSGIPGQGCCASIQNMNLSGGDMRFANSIHPFFSCVR